MAHRLFKRLTPLKAFFEFGIAADSQNHLRGVTWHLIFVFSCTQWTLWCKRIYIRIDRNPEPIPPIRFLGISQFLNSVQTLDVHAWHSVLWSRSFELRWWSSGFWGQNSVFWGRSFMQKGRSSELWGSRVRVGGRRFDYRRRAMKPACSKWRSWVKASRIFCCCMIRNEAQSVWLQALSALCS